MDHRPLITMKNLGRWGRFANQIFQYAFLRIYCNKNNFRYQVPSWAGQHIFDIQDPLLSENNFSTINEGLGDTAYNGDLSTISGSNPPVRNVDIIGYFQYHTSWYLKHQKFFRSIFKPKPNVENSVKKTIDVMRNDGNNTVIGFHLRRGDYGTYEKPGSRCFFVTPEEWYLAWLEENWDKYDNPVLFIASDELPKIIGAFKKYNPITNQNQGVCFPKVSMYPDFYTLSQCDVLCTSNSSFSFAASMLNENGKFYRPRLSEKSFLSYDPWDSHTIFRDEEY